MGSSSTIYPNLTQQANRVRAHQFLEPLAHKEVKELAWYPAISDFPAQMMRYYFTAGSTRVSLHIHALAAVARYLNWFKITSKPTEL